MQLLLLTLATAAGIYARTAIGPVQESMRTALALTDNQIALLQGPALAFPAIIAAVPLGLAVDRCSRVRLLTLFAVLNLVCSVLTALARDFVTLFALRCVIGLCTIATAMAAFSLIADLHRPERRGRASMVMGMGQVAGGSAAFALGGALIAKFGATPAGWQATMLWLSSPLLVVAMLVWSMREPARTGVANRNSSVREACGALWRYRGSIAPLLAGTTMVAVADGAVLIWAAPTLARNFALSPERVGATMATALLIMGVLGPVAGGMLADSSQRRGGPRRTMRNLSLLACLSVPAAMFAMLSGATLASGLLCVFLTIGSAVGMGVTTVLTIVIPNELRGLTLTVVSATGALFGLGCAPVLVSALSGLLGGPASLGAALSVVCGAMSAAGAAALAYGSRRSPLQEGAG